MAVAAALLLAACNGDNSARQGEAGQLAGAGQESPGGQLPGSDAPAVIETVRFQASDGARLHAIVRGAGDFSPRPLIVEFSPYGSGSDIPDFGPDYNHVFVHARGTGNSTGQWGAVGPRDQQDVAEFLAWACVQPWSNGRIGLYGFSASAIAIYNAMHLPLACVEAAALMAGTHDLYRDLLYPGGIPNIAPAIVVGTGVGVPILQSTPQRLQDGQMPLDPLLSGLGILQILPDAFLAHITEDEYWLDRTQRPGPNNFPVLANTGFYDVESRGPFQSYQMLRDLGVTVHLRVFGAHDGFPEGTQGPFPEYRRWFDHFLLGEDNGIDHEAPVQLLIGHGSYEAQLAGAVSKLDAEDWPVPGTVWQPLYLDGARGGGAFSINDGRLSRVPVAGEVTQIYPALTSLPTATDPNTTATVASAGANTLFGALPLLTQLTLMEPLSLTYTTSEFTQDVDVVGPASLVVYLSTLLPESDIHAVIADVWPDGSSHPVGIGRLRTSYPYIVPERSLTGANGEVVQPYPDHSAKTPAMPGQLREYHVEFWPLGNRFQAGHRLRLYLLGAPTYLLPAPNLNLVSVGGDKPSRLLIPVLPGNDLSAALADQVSR